MDLLGAIGSGVEVVKFIWSPFTCLIDSVIKLENNTSIMERKKLKLVTKETDMKKALKRESDQGKEPTFHVTELLGEVETAINEASNIALEVEENGKWYLHCWSRMKLTERVAEVTQEIDRLLGETNKFPLELAVNRSPPRAPSLPTPSLVGKSTVEKNWEAIMDSLRDPRYGKISVYGMGGCGKTTTMMNISNELATSNEFDKIIWVTVSKDMILHNIQKGIGEQLSIDLSAYQDDVVRAGKISERLKQIQVFFSVPSLLFSLFTFTIA